MTSDNDSDNDPRTRSRSFAGTRMPRYQHATRSGGERRHDEFVGTRLPKDQGIRRSQKKDVPTIYQDEYDSQQREAILQIVKQLLNEGRLYRVMIKDEHDTVLHEISLRSGIAKTVLFPSIASLIGLSAMATKRKVVIERIENPEK